MGSVAFKLTLPGTVRVHPVFHVSQLCKATEATFPVCTAPPVLATNLKLPLRPSAILVIRRSSTDELEVLIHWEESTTADATWELKSDIIDQFSDFHLEDNVALWRGG